MTFKIIHAGATVATGIKSRPKARRLARALWLGPGQAGPSGCAFSWNDRTGSMTVDDGEQAWDVNIQVVSEG